jgi:hypothetical protein
MISCPSCGALLGRADNGEFFYKTVTDELRGKLYQFDPPEGYCYKCPDCKLWATLGGNAAFHMSKQKHGMPYLQPIKKSWLPMSIQEIRKALHEIRRVGTITPAGQSEQFRLHTISELDRILPHL